MRILLLPRADPQVYSRYCAATWEPGAVGRRPVARGVRLEHTDESRPALGMHAHRHRAPRFRNHPDARGPGVRRRTHAQVRAARRGTARPPGGAAEGDRRRRAAGLPARDPRHPRGRLARRRRSRPTCWTAASRSPARSTARWSSTRSTRARRCSWPTSRTRSTPDLGQPGRRARSTCATRSPARIEFTSPEGQAVRAQARRSPTLIVRPRGWHLDEKHVRVDGEPMSGALFDFGLFAFHNARASSKRQGRGPYFYLPKLQSHLEARAVGRGVRPRRSARSACPAGRSRSRC